MYRKIKRLNQIISELVEELQIDMNEDNLDNIYKILNSKKLYDYLDEIFKEEDYILKESLNICNKFTYTLIEIYFETNGKKIIESKRKPDYNDRRIFNDNYNIYRADINDVKFFTKEKERQLIEDYKINHNQNSKDLIILSYQRLILKMAKAKTNDKYLLLDLIQAGNISLLLCLESYDLKSNCRLSTYAYLNIKKHIEREYSRYKYSYLHSEKNMLLKNTIDIYVNEYYMKNGYELTKEEIIKKFNLEPEKYEAIEKLRKIDSLNKDVIIEKEEMEFLALIPDNTNLEIEIENKIIYKNVLNILKTILSEREFIVYTNYLGLEGVKKTQEQIAMELEISRQYVSVIYKRCLNKIEKDKTMKVMKKIYLS